MTDQPEIEARMLATLRDWHASWPPLRERTLDVDDETREHLRQLGYIVE